MKHFLAIIGGGPAGYTAAEMASRAGKDVILFEQTALGGTCLNVGCIPTKTLLYSAKQYYNAKNAAKYGGEALSAILGVMKVYDTARQYELILDQWEEDLTTQMNTFPVGSTEYELYAEIISQLRQGIENEVANTIFEVIKPFITGELGLKDIPTYVAKAFGVTLSLPVQRAKLGLTVTIADNSGSKGKMWDMDTIYSSYCKAQDKLVDALEQFKQAPSESSFEMIEGWVAYYQMLRASAINMMESIVKSDANRWSDVIVLSALDMTTLPYRLAPAFLNWLITGDDWLFSTAASRVEDKDAMKTDIAAAKESDLEDMLYLDAYVFPLKGSYSWVKKQAE